MIAIVCADLLIVLIVLGIRVINSHRSDNTVVKNTSVPETAPGIVVSGSVRNSNGVGVENVAIYAKYAGYAKLLIATTDNVGNYQSVFYTIPGDEMVTVWAERSGLQFKADTCYWQHYSGHELKACDFLAQPIMKIYLPLVTRAIY